MLTLTSEQRQAIENEGVPLPVVDEGTGEAYMLLPVEFLPDPELGGYTARIPGISAYGDGETKEDAILSLQAALSAYIEAFGDEDSVPL
jgi:hypothetical protein